MLSDELEIMNEIMNAYNECINLELNSLIQFCENISITKFVNIMKYIDGIYYEGVSELNDEKYDAMKDILKQRDPNNAYFKQIGTNILAIDKLPYKMGSLDKVKMNDFDEKDYNEDRYIISDKLDGISCQLYRNLDGEYVMYTRGDGIYGRKINYFLNRMLKFNRIDKSVMKNMEIGMSIRGELIISKKNFISHYGQIYKNSRNAVSGIVADISNDHKVYINFVAYNILYPIMNTIDQLNLIYNMGFECVPYAIINDKLTSHMLMDIYEQRKECSKYNIDGIVISTCENIQYGELNPINVKAFKHNFDNSIFEANVIDVVWNISKYGYIKPVVIIDPIEMDVTINKASGYNASFIVENKIGPGTKIRMVRSGDVIPKIVSIIKSTYAKMPTIDYIWNDTHVDIMCDNKIDMDKINMKLNEHFFKTIGVKNMGSKFIQKLYDNGYTNILKIITADKDDLLLINGFGVRLINKIYDDIIDILPEIELSTFMYATLIFGRGIGIKILKLVVDSINIHSEINGNALMNINRDVLMNINGISEITCNKIINNLKKFITYHAQFINAINNRFNLSIDYIRNYCRERKINIKSALMNMEFVFTGFRDELIEETIKNNGGKIANNVSNKTTALFYKSNKLSEKINYAQKLQIQMIEKENSLYYLNNIIENEKGK